MLPSQGSFPLAASPRRRLDLLLVRRLPVRRRRAIRWLPPCRRRDFPRRRPREPLVRAKGYDEEPAARPAPLSLPSPEQLGVARRAPETVDWTATHQRLEELGAVGFQLESLTGGGFRFSCLIPTGQPDRAYRIEGQGTTQAEAVRIALERAAPYRRGRG